MNHSKPAFGPRETGCWVDLFVLSLLLLQMAQRRSTSKGRQTAKRQRRVVQESESDTGPATDPASSSEEEAGGSSDSTHHSSEDPSEASDQDPGPSDPQGRSRPAGKGAKALAVPLRLSQVSAEDRAGFASLFQASKWFSLPVIELQGVRMGRVAVGWSWGCMNPPAMHNCSARKRSSRTSRTRLLAVGVGMLSGTPHCMLQRERQPHSVSAACRNIANMQHGGWSQCLCSNSLSAVCTAQVTAQVLGSHMSSPLAVMVKADFSEVPLDLKRFRQHVTGVPLKAFFDPRTIKVLQPSEAPVRHRGPVWSIGCCSRGEGSEG